MIDTNKTASSFSAWVWYDKENQRLLILSLTCTLIAFIVLKWLFPFPNFLPDSSSYLEAAFANRGISIWPIGYSSFLRIISTFTRSASALVFFQYFLLQTSAMYFLLTIRYWLSPSTALFRILVICTIINPLSLLVSNYISSDALFAALSLIWLSQLIWILFRPQANLLVIHAFTLLFALMIRYNALYYPIISFSALAISHATIRNKILGIGCAVFLLAVFLVINISKYRHSTGTYQFSAFSGWQLASNALFAYAHSIPDTTEKVPKQFRALHTMVNHHMDSLERLLVRPDQELGAYYLWDENAPLKKYFQRTANKDSSIDPFQKWASLGPLYANYGSWLISRRPIDYLKYYIWPNMINYYVPRVEFLGMYNMEKDSIDDIETSWFGYKSNKVNAAVWRMNALEAFPVLLAIVNLLFFLCIISFWLLEGFRKSGSHFSQFIKWMAFIWIVNFCFSVLASPIVLRYQIFNMIVTVISMFLLLGYIIQETSFSRSTSIRTVPK